MTYEYIAGFFDGEGCICIRKGKSGLPRVSISMTQKTLPVLEAIQKFLEYGSIRWVDDHYYILSFSNRQDQRHFLQVTLPYLIVKRRKADIALRLVDLVGGKGPVSETVKRERMALFSEYQEMIQ